MTNVKKGHLLETFLWLIIVAVFYGFSFEFDQEIEIYKYGATGWPRAILIILLIVILGNFVHIYKKGSDSQKGRVGISDEQEDISYNDFGSILKLFTIINI